AQFVVTGGSFTATDGINSFGSIDVEGGTVLLGGGTDTAALTVAGGTLTGSGDVLVDGTLTWLGGTIAGGGTIVVDPGTAASLTGGAHTLAKSLLNFGTVAHSAGDLTVDTSAGDVDVTNFGSWT